MVEYKEVRSKESANYYIRGYEEFRGRMVIICSLPLGKGAARGNEAQHARGAGGVPHA